MVLPDPIDAKVLARKSLALQAGFLQQADRSDVGGNASGLDPMQLQGPEREGNDRVHGRSHVTLAGISGTHPIAEAASLGAAAADIGKGETTDEGIVALAKNKEGVGEVAALVLGIALDPAAE